MDKFVGWRRHLPTGEIVVGVALVILSVGVLPLWTALVGLAFGVLGIAGLPSTRANVIGAGQESKGGNRFWIVLPIGALIAWLVWPTPVNRAAVNYSVPLSAALDGPLPVPAPRPEKAPAPTSRLTDGVRLAVLSAKHKHRGRDCEGVLTFSANAVRFRTAHPEDSFVYAIDQVALDNDGVRDRSGKAWHFMVDGRDMEDTFRRWKAGTLPMQPTTRQ